MPVIRELPAIIEKDDPIIDFILQLADSESFEWREDSVIFSIKTLRIRWTHESIYVERPVGTDESETWSLFLSYTCSNSMTNLHTDQDNKLYVGMVALLNAAKNTSLLQASEFILDKLQMHDIMTQIQTNPVQFLNTTEGGKRAPVLRVYAHCIIG